jgi:hypothetical protein
MGAIARNAGLTPQQFRDLLCAPPPEPHKVLSRVQPSEVSGIEQLRRTLEGSGGGSVTGLSSSAETGINVSDDRTD